MADEAELKNNNGRISIGYALPPKKVETVISPSLLSHSESRGIDLIQVKLDQPLLQQGPFHCLIHKVYDESWNTQLLGFHSQYPNVPIIDHPAAIQRIHNRISMLDVVHRLNSAALSVGIPKQVLLSQLQTTDESGLRYPLIAKPVLANGDPNSHQMMLVYDAKGLQKVREQQAEFVLQEFVNHGGVLFKVYVAGKHVKCAQRNSLPDFHVSYHPLLKEEGVMPFSQISNLPSQQSVDDIVMPGLDFLNELASGLREGTQLNLFNFDLIRDESDPSGNKYLIIDINYFPGYAKLPGFEEMLTDFFLDVVNQSGSDVENA